MDWKERWAVVRSDLRGDFFAVVVGAVFLGNLLTAGVVGGGAYAWFRWQTAEYREDTQKWNEDVRKWNAGEPGAKQPVWGRKQ